METNPQTHIYSVSKNVLSIIFRIKLLIVFILMGISTVYAADKISRNKINLKFENVTIKCILSSIEKQTDYIFIYNGDVVNSNDKKSIITKNASIESVLDVLFKGMDVELRIDGRQVYILKKTKQFPEKPIAVRKGISPQVRCYNTVYI